MTRERATDNRPFLALGAALVLLLVALAVPATREWLASEVGAPLRAQADPGADRGGYTLASLLAWALVGIPLAWVAYELVFARLGYAPDRSFFLALAPFLVAGPLAHALMAAGAFPAGSGLAYATTEPPIYLTTAALVVAALAAGRAARRPFVVPLALGLALLIALLALAAPLVATDALGQSLAVLALALAPTALLAWAFHAWRRDPPLGAVAAVVGAHALDGATTWMVLRDPFGLGFAGFAEKNPVSLLLVNLANGWPFFAVKLALPLALILAVKTERDDPRLRAFLLFAIFVLGFGPGMSNLLQVLLG